MRGGGGACIVRLVARGHLHQHEQQLGCLCSVEIAEVFCLVETGKFQGCKDSGKEEDFC